MTSNLSNIVVGNYIGEIKKGRDINRSNINQDYKWNPCPSCGTPKWTHICKGEMHHLLCHECVTKQARESVIDKRTGKKRGEVYLDIPPTKYCHGCQRDLPLSSFYKGKDNRLKLRSMCKECGKKRNKEYCKTVKGKETVRKSSQKYYYSEEGRGKAISYRNSDNRKNNLAKRSQYYDGLVDKPSMKVCSICKNELPFSFFYKEEGGKYNLRASCKRCETRLRQEYRETEHGKKVVEAYYNSSEYKESRKIYRIKYSKTENYINYQKKYKKTDKSKQKDSERAKTPEYKKKKKEYYQTEKGKATVARCGHRRRIRDKSVPATLTDTEWKEIKKRYNYRCVYCGKKKPLTRDHIIPLSKGGGLTKENVVPACKSCNSSKLDKPVLLQILAMTKVE